MEEVQVMVRRLQPVFRTPTIFQHGWGLAKRLWDELCNSCSSDPSSPQCTQPKTQHFQTAVQAFSGSFVGWYPPCGCSTLAPLDTQTLQHPNIEVRLPVLHQGVPTEP